MSKTKAREAMWDVLSEIVESGILRSVHASNATRLHQQALDALVLAAEEDGDASAAPSSRRPGGAFTPVPKEAEMSRTVNKVVLVGNVGSDPDLHITANGEKKAKLSLATTTREGNEERTDWHRVRLHGRQAQFAEDYVSRGDKLYVEGRLEYDSYERDGITIPTTEIRASEIVLLNPMDG
ncbi:MAG: single-stranded DNA-binding protein [Gammaproteobacteria bacterium]|nr:single-stranded DNA-binding protein [Gammaproteobacteria bacterium]